MSERDDEAGEAQRRLSADLPRELSPRPEVEDRIVAALRARGLIRTAWTRSRLAARLAAAAAGLALLAAGFAVGRGSTPRPGDAPAEPRFALFLLRGSERLPENPGEEAGRVAEYRSWARGLAGAGRFVSGEKLEDRGEQIGAPGGAAASVPEEEVRGFFIISAENFEDALAIARQCPHLRHGGRILVRPIARV
jgi:hypothetical protein